MYANALAENICGTIGTVLWSGQIIPQIYKTHREKTSAGLSPYLMFIWAVSAAFLGVYAIVQDINIPLIVQPQAFGSLAALSWVQCLYYDPKRSKTVCALIFLTFIVVFASFEISMVYATRAAIKKGDEHLLPFFGVFSALLISLGLVPQFIEIYRLKEVRGISFLFMAFDIGGGLFSLLSLIFKTQFDGLAAGSYLAVIVLDGAIVLLAYFLNPRARRQRDAEAETTNVPSVGEQSGSLILVEQQKQPNENPDPSRIL